MVPDSCVLQYLPPFENMTDGDLYLFATASIDGS
jgi:hypothetical protein